MAVPRTPISGRQLGLARRSRAGYPPVHARQLFRHLFHERKIRALLRFPPEHHRLPQRGDAFVASALEFEYGIKTWWTTSFTLRTDHIRPEHAVHWFPLGESHPHATPRALDQSRPLLRIRQHQRRRQNSARVVGQDSRADFLVVTTPGEETRAEFKLILSSNFKGWNISENFLAEKNLANAPWEFGYALGGSRILPQLLGETLHLLPPELRGGR